MFLIVEVPDSFGSFGLV